MTAEPTLAGAAPGRAAAASRRAFPGLRLLVTAGLLAALVWMIDPLALARVVSGARPDLLSVMFLLLIGERLMAAVRWHMLLRIVVPAIPLWPVLRLTLVSSFIGSFMPGGVGIEVLKVHGLARYAANLPLALSSVLLERLFGLLGLMMMIGLGLLLAPVSLPPAVTGLLAVAAFSLVALGAVLLLRPVRQGLARICPPVVARRLGRPFGRLGQVLDAYGQTAAPLALALVLGFLFQSLRVLTVVVGAAALGIAVDPLVFVVVVPIGILIALMPISLGGYGPREATYVGLLGLAGVAPEAALALALTREVLSLAAVLPGAWLYARGPLAPALSAAD